MPLNYESILINVEEIADHQRVSPKYFEHLLASFAPPFLSHIFAMRRDTHVCHVPRSDHVARDL